MFIRGPIAMPGQRIGLLGGSFDPPHEGHVHITLWALRAFGLDRVWWLLSPGNPLKRRGPVDIDRRMAAARAMMRHPRVLVTDIERHFSSPYTADTLRRLAQRYPAVKFVWLMGADNLVNFHHWDDWDWILRSHPVGVLGRPGEQLRAGLSPAARLFSRWRLRQGSERILGEAAAPAWALVTGPMSGASSTRLRAEGAWP